MAGWNRFPCGGHANFTASHPVWLITGREPSKPNTVDDFWSHPSDKHYSISVASTQVGQNKNMKCRECLINNRAWVAVENLLAKARFGRGARPVERISFARLDARDSRHWTRCTSRRGALRSLHHVAGRLTALLSQHDLSSQVTYSTSRCGECPRMNCAQ